MKGLINLMKGVKGTTKDFDNYLNARIKESTNSTVKFGASDAEILLVIVDYLINSTDGVRQTAKRTGHSKTWVWRVLRSAPMKYDDKLARLVYYTMYANTKANHSTVTIGKGDMNKLRNAKIKLTEMKDDFKSITKLKAKLILWF